MNAGIGYVNEGYTKDPYYEVEGAAAADQAEAEIMERQAIQLRVEANLYLQGLPESVWMNPTLTDIKKAYIAGKLSKEQSAQVSDTTAAQSSNKS